jgi:hypothetical protein
MHACYPSQIALRQSQSRAHGPDQDQIADTLGFFDRRFDLARTTHGGPVEKEVKLLKIFNNLYKKTDKKSTPKAQNWVLFYKKDALSLEIMSRI